MNSLSERTPCNMMLCVSLVTCMQPILTQSSTGIDVCSFVDQEFQPLERYLYNHALRRDAYFLLQRKGDALILQALGQLTPEDRQEIQDYGRKCQRDMSYVLLSISLAILKEDGYGLEQQSVLWIQDVMGVLKKEAQSIKAYQLLRAAIADLVETNQAELINTYLDSFIENLESKTSPFRATSRWT